MKNDFLIAITQLAAERNLPREMVLGAVESALASAFRRETATGVQNVSVRIIPATGEVIVFAQKEVVEEVEDSRSQITLADARRIRPEAEIGDVVEVEAPSQEAGRIAAQTAKQVVMQRLRAAQSDLVYEEFSAKHGDMLSGVVQKMETRQVILDLGRAEALLPVVEQVPTERYRPGQRLKVLITDVQRATKGPQIIVSRTHKDILRRLFELEVPEVMNGTVVIRSVAREPGIRSKVAVEARQEGVDAVGSCVGLRGIRIQNIVNELHGEKVDVVQWSREPGVFIANALSPAQVNEVNAEPEGNGVEVVVPDRQLSLAIGREGQNARLAAKLTGFRIDIKSVSESLTEQTERTARQAEERAATVTGVEAPRAEAVVEIAPAAAAPPEAPEALPAVVDEPASAAEVAPISPQAAPVLAGLELEQLLAPAAPEEVKEEEEEETRVPVFDMQAWIRSQQPVEGAPVLRFAEDIMPGRGGGGGSRRDRRRGRNTEEPVRGRRPPKNVPAGDTPDADSTAIDSTAIDSTAEENVSE